MASETKQTDRPADPRVYFAAERTLLAWVRTGLAMMGFGFVVARFGLFLREMADFRAVPSPPQHGFSLGVGMALVVLGVLVNLCAAIGHWRTVRRLEKDLPIEFRALSLGTILAVTMGILGLLMAAYLFFGLSAAD